MLIHLSLKRPRPLFNKRLKVSAIVFQLRLGGLSSGDVARDGNGCSLAKHRVIDSRHSDLYRGTLMGICLIDLIDKALPCIDRVLRDLRLTLTREDHRHNRAPHSHIRSHPE